MYGIGILKGMGVTIKRFIETYVHDLRYFPRRSLGTEAIKVRQSSRTRGLFTVQYPDEKLPVPERYRSLPMLIVDEATGKERCRACGICAKVCPPQCIWIVRDMGPDGKPIPRPTYFVIDAMICMSCGFCAEFCPFDAIKINHDYELSSGDRYRDLVYEKERLVVPTSYYAQGWPKAWAAEGGKQSAKEES
jgi:NADH-quinone oxidoreductase subunit I